jgi:hypothetical protein
LNKEPILRIANNFSAHNKNTINPIKDFGKKKHGQLFHQKIKKDTGMANKHMKRCSPLLVIMKAN